MAIDFIVAVRNDYGQLLILVTSGLGTPTLPVGSFDGGPALTTVQKQIVDDTGLEIRGLHLVSTRGPSHAKQLHRYTAFVSGGKLRTPPCKLYSSASWIAYELAMKIEGLSTAARELLQDVAWMHERVR